MRAPKRRYTRADYYAFTAPGKQQALDFAVDKVKAGEWPNHALAGFLAALTPYQEHGQTFKIDDAMGLLGGAGPVA